MEAASRKQVKMPVLLSYHRTIIKLHAYSCVNPEKITTKEIFLKIWFIVYTFACISEQIPVNSQQGQPIVLQTGPLVVSLAFLN